MKTAFSLPRSYHRYVKTSIYTISFISTNDVKQFPLTVDKEGLAYSFDSFSTELLY